jgi:diguanylate cyclase (GGDEF)-like protein
MRVRDKSGDLAPAGATPLGAAGSASRPAAAGANAAAQGVQGARPPIDIATIMGVPEAELTPKVRAALDKLLAEVQTLREDLDRSRRRIEYLEQLADRDPLAPVLNRRAFVRELTRMIAFSERYGAPGSVVYLDIDGMKHINDSHGHGAGDAALKHVAEVLLRGVRASDIVGRLGGDEFGIILAQADGQAAAAKAAVLATAIESEPISWQAATLTLGVSYGTYTFAGGEGVDEALSAADRAMYAHKHGGETGGGSD